MHLGARSDASRGRSPHSCRFLRLLNEATRFLAVLLSVVELVEVGDYLRLHRSFHRFSCSSGRLLEIFALFEFASGSLLRLVILKQSLELLFFAVFLQDPVKLTIVVPAVAGHNCLEEASEEVVVGLFLKFQSSAVHDKLVELFRHSRAKLLHGRRDLLFSDPVILFILVLALKSLPRENSLQEVEENIANAL